MDALPEHGFVFWYVGNGDSTTVAVDATTIVQIDVHALESADDEGDPHGPIVDGLVELLPKNDDGKPYL